MHTLELKIRPLALMVLFALLMWLLAQVVPPFAVPAVLLERECALKGKNKLPLPKLTADIASWLRSGTSFAELPSA